MANLAHLFKVGQKVKIRNNDFDALHKFSDGVVKETHEDHIIVTETKTNTDGWYEEEFNIELIYPDYNF